MPYTEYSTFCVTVDAGVAHVTFDHPPINLLDVAMVTELNRFVAAVREDGHVRVIVFQSANPEFFIAHTDMTWLTTEGLYAKLAESETTLSPLNPLQRLHERLRSLPQVTIAKISGFARCGGSEFTMALDMRFAAKSKAGLAQSEVLMGIFPGGGGTAYLPPLVGRARALEIILGAGLFDAELAERYGWINRALPADELDSYVDDLARRIAQLPAEVVASATAAIDAAADSTPKGMSEENSLVTSLMMMPEALEKVRAALKAGAQTPEGERDLEGLLNGI